MNVGRKVKQMLPKGFSLQQNPDGSHFKIVDSNGNIVRHDNGMPMTISCSPSCGHWHKNVAKEIARLCK